MNNREVWNNFLDNIKNEITNVSFDTWFNEEDTKFHSFKNNIMTITVNQEFIKKHITKQSGIYKLGIEIIELIK